MVDCSYAYNLDTKRYDSSDKAPNGTYRSWVNIDGDNLDDPALFSVKAQSASRGDH